MLFTEISCENRELCKRVYKAGQVTLACTTATVAIPGRVAARRPFFNV
jgi:hypothetical protein